MVEVLQALAGDFEARVDRTTDPGGCHPWLGLTNNDGYGVFQIGKRTLGTRRRIAAHRVSYQLHVGPIPDGLVVRHQCDNPPCCNPAHLMVGTNADNVRDMKSRSRNVRGEASPQAKLTEGDVLAIRSAYAAGGISQKALGAMYGVSQARIAFVVTRKGWMHV